MENNEHVITVDEAIKLLTEYKNMYDGGDHKLEVQVYGRDVVGYLVGSVYDIDHEDGPYCTIYCNED